MRTSIGGFIMQSAAGREQLPILEAPSSDEVQAYLDAVMGKFGIISMENVTDDGADPTDLTLYAAGGTYLLLLTAPSGDGIEVRTYQNSQAADKFVEILGEPHHASTTFSEFEVARAAFEQFRETGDVSRDLLA